MERRLGAGLRLLFAVIGIAAVTAPLQVALVEARSTGGSRVVRMLVMIICVPIVVGGGVLLRGALRGRMPVRRP
jgi:hypothetical protein